MAQTTHDNIGKNLKSNRVTPTFFPPFEAVVCFPHSLRMFAVSVSTERKYRFYRHHSDHRPPTWCSGPGSTISQWHDRICLCLLLTYFSPECPEKYLP